MFFLKIIFNKLTVFAVFFFFFPLFTAALSKEFSFMGLKLGMSESEVTNILSHGSLLTIDESRYFGKINDAVPFIIKADYYPFIDSLYIQFYNNTAYGITILFDREYFDFFSISSKLEDKYGPPVLRTSKLVLWEDTVSNSISTDNTLSNSSLSNASMPSPAVPGAQTADRGIKLRLEFPSTVKIFNYDIMQKVNTELSQSTVKITNESIIQSNRRALLDEL